MRTIYVLPYGGGSASSYRTYAETFPREVGRVLPVELPGRGRRSAENAAGSMRDCAALALQQIDAEAGDYVLHGHCMGALLAFEAIKLLHASGRTLPRFMIASGRNAPNHMNAWLTRVARLDDRSLFEELRHLGGVPKGLSFAMAHPFLSVIRADQLMYRDYDAGETEIDVPILVLAGQDDSMTDPKGLDDWRRYTSKGVDVRWFPGQHYFLLQQADAVASHIEAFDRAMCAASGAAG